MSKRAYVVGTCDTKSEELHYVRDLLEAAGIRTCLVDVGIKSDAKDVDVTNAEVAAHGRGGAAILSIDDRGAAVTLMSEAFANFLRSREDIAGIIGAGGSGNTTLVTHGMQALPVGLPKLMVSTVAAGNIGPYIGGSDICMLYAVTDVAGLNSISRVVLGNAAHAMAGMIGRPVPRPAQSKRAAGLTMYGVTTPCVTNVRKRLEADFDCLVFHATPTGRQSLEKLVESNLLAGVLDITTTQVVVYGEGIARSNETCFDAVIKSRLPFVGSLGAQDMVNFGPPETIPQPFKHRLFYLHNAYATLMRTNRDECAAIGRWLGEKLNRFEGPMRFLLPERGVSMIDAAGQPFFDPEADAALFEAIERTVKETKSRRVIRVPRHINEPEFAAAAVEHFLEITSTKSAGVIPSLSKEGIGGGTRERRS
ncbi:MAG: Tm-1-like ATP-binding domain-containing protein [Planctomycetes bacterium]|nr:Tm-1-like ATP-binding domain-containing protein [Planctomycetota bacterium]